MTEESLFVEALSRKGEERVAFLNQACAGQPELRAAVEALLAAHDRPNHILDRSPVALGQTVDSEAGAPASGPTGAHTPRPEEPPQSATVDDRSDAQPGAVIGGRYTLVERLGEGGMGEVWVAKQTEPVKRKVALKLIKAGMDSKAVLSRFEQERQALALMDHPNIARVLDGGVTPDRRPFFVMELVNGLPLTRFCDEAKLGIRPRLELFSAICQAVQHAHQKGIIHRDLKPANVLVTVIDGRGVPKVIDFGVAKATSGRLTEESLSTQFGAVVGTLEYMSPEQASFSGVDIDTRADIYSLGVILYELLTGLRPIDAKRLKKAALTEMIRIIQEEEPSKPSTRLSTHEAAPSLAALRQTEPKRLSALLRGELDWVVLKCLEKQRDRRYETANALARDVQRYLADEAVEARPPSAGYRLRKFVRRHKGQVVAASLVLLALLAGMAGTTWGLFEARRQEQEARRQEGLARDEAEEKDRARQAEAQRVKERDGALKREAQRAQERDKALKREGERADELRYRLGVSFLVLAGAAYDNRDVRLAADRLDKVPAEQRGWEWRHLEQQTRGGIFTLYASGTKTVAFSPDGTRIVTGGRGAREGQLEVKVFDARTGTELLALQGLPNVGKLVNPGACVAFSPNGTQLVVACHDKTARVFDARTGELLRELKGHTTGVCCAVFSPDGTRIVTGGHGLPRTFSLHEIIGKQGPGETKVWDARTGKFLFELKGHPGAVTCVAFSPDGTRIVTGGGDYNLPGEVMVWDAARGGKALLELKGITSWWSTVAFSPDSKRIVAGNEHGTATVVDAITGAVLLKLRERSRDMGGIRDLWVSRGVRSAAFSPDGTRIVTTGGTRTSGEVTVWDARTGTELLALQGHTSWVLNSAFSPDSTRIITGSVDGTVKVFDARTGTGRRQLGEQWDAVSSLAFSRDGTRIVTGNLDGTAKVWDARNTSILFELKGNKGPVRSVALSTDGTRIVTAGGGVGVPGHATVWDAETGKAVVELKGLQEPVLSAAFSTDGTRIATGAAQLPLSNNSGYELKMWDARTGKILYDLTEARLPVENPTARGWTVAFSPDGTRFVTAGGSDAKQLGHVVRVRDVRTGKALREIKTEALCLSLSTDGKRIVTGSPNNLAKVWDAETGRQLLELKGHTGMVQSAVFSPDGTRIVTGSYDKTVKVWDVRTGTALVELKGHQGAVQCVTFSPDGTQLLTGGGDPGKLGEAYVWDARAHTPNLLLEGHEHGARCVAFSPDGTRVVTLNSGVDQVADSRTDPDGTRVVTLDVGVGQVWDTRTGAALAKLKAMGTVKSLAFSLDGTRIVSTHYDKTVKVWDAKTGRERKGERAPQTVPNDWTSPDGRFFARVDGKRVEVVALQLDEKELAYRRSHTRPDPGRYREGYQAARDARDEFAAAFYRKLVPPEERKELEAQADTRLVQRMRDRITTALQVGMPDQAVPVYLELLSHQKARLGAEHDDTLQTQTRLGVLYWRLRQFDKSIPMFEALWKVQTKKHGADHFETLNAAANLGTSYKDAGKAKEAIPLLEPAYRAVKKHPNLFWVKEPLIDAYTSAGENDKAAVLLLDNINGIRRMLPRGNPQLNFALAEHARRLLENKRWEEADRLLRECLTIRLKYMPDDWRTVSTWSMLGGALLGRKKYADAEPLLLKGYEGMKKREQAIPPAGRPRLVEAAQRLVRLYEATGKKTEAAKWRKELDAIKAAHEAEKKP